MQKVVKGTRLKRARIRSVYFVILVHALLFCEYVFMFKSYCIVTLGRFTFYVLLFSPLF